MKKLLLISAAFAMTVLSLGSARAEHSEVGTLSCDVSAGIGVIVGSKRDVSCVFSPTGNSGPTEKYIGSITEFGLDVGTVSKGEMTWLVFDTTSKSKNALAGTYRGASADATVVVGGDVNVLVGGDGNHLSLQPLSVEGNEGLNLAVGVAALTLRPQTTVN